MNDNEETFEMKKRRTALIILALAACILSGCCRHSWKGATCTAPKTCRNCNETEGTALGHNWYGTVSCTESKTCITCGAIGEKATGHDWANATDTTPRICRTCGTMEPMKLPANGEVFIGSDTYYNGSELTIKSSTTQSCYVKLKDFYGNDVHSFFVRAGENVTADVPRGYYYIYFAYGTDWYGPEYVFGPETSYAKDSVICNFESYTWSYTLYPTAGGNFSQTPISGDDF